MCPVWDKHKKKEAVYDAFIYSMSIMFVLVSLTIISSIIILLFKGESLILDAVLFAMIMTSIVALLSALARRSEQILRIIITYILTLLFLYIIFLSPTAQIPSDKTNFVAMFLGGLVGLLISKSIFLNKKKEEQQFPALQE